jgi:NADPH:quinone reductase-like Zn-dependent oxidoreductase
MKALILNQYGDPDVLTIADQPVPAYADDEVLVRVHAASVNPFDAKLRRGYLHWFYPLPFPFILGADFSGVVEAVGPGVTRFKVGDDVWGLTQPQRNGAYAEYVALKAEGIRLKPPSLSHVEAAAMPMAAMTAWYMLMDMITLTPAHRILVHAGAGGVGGYSLQIAKHTGARVFTTCSGPNIGYVTRLGADEVCDYTTQDFTQMFKDMDFAVDQLGGEVSLRTYLSMKRGGEILLVERGHKVEMEHRAANTEKYGVRLSEVAFENVPDSLDKLSAGVAAGWLKSTLEEVIGLDGVADAHARIQAKHVRGKIVIDLSGSR